MKAKEVIKMFQNATLKGRHGDVVIVHDPAVPTDGDECNDRCVAYGEVTGHAHRVSEAQVVKLLNDTVQRAIIVSKGKAKISHEEHMDAALPKGKYRSGIQQQYSPDGWSRVQD